MGSLDAINQRGSVNAFDPVEVSEIIHVPSDHVSGCMSAVGKALSPAMPKGGHPALTGVVVQDRFAWASPAIVRP